MLHQRCLNCSTNASRDTLYSLPLRHNIRVTHEMVLLIAHRIRSTEGSSADCSLFILSLHALALHLAVKIPLPSLFCMEDLSTLTLHTSVGCIFLRMPAGPHFVTQPILLMKTFLIFDINHQQNTRLKTRLKR